MKNKHSATSISFTGKYKSRDQRPETGTNSRDQSLQALNYIKHANISMKIETYVHYRICLKMHIKIMTLGNF